MLMVLGWVCAAGCSDLPSRSKANGATPSVGQYSEASDPSHVRAAEPELVQLSYAELPVTESNADAGAGTGSDDSVCHAFSTQDRGEFLSDLVSDTKELFTWRNGMILLVGAGASVGIHDGLDDEVARDTLGHEQRWGDIDGFFKAAGNPLTHLSAAAGLYAYSLWENDAELHDLSKTLIDVVAIDAAATNILKVAANTRRPNGDPWGFPSGHVSSSVAVAAVLDEYYGHAVGIPAYLFAGLVAWERIDDREHDLSDVVFGALLGFVIGQTIGADHHTKFCGLECIPYVDPVTSAPGLALEREF
jgi:hypothetical protein